MRVDAEVRQAAGSAQRNLGEGAAGRGEDDEGVVHGPWFGTQELGKMLQDKTGCTMRRSEHKDGLYSH